MNRRTLLTATLGAAAANPATKIQAQTPPSAPQGRGGERVAGGKRSRPNPKNTADKKGRLDVHAHYFRPGHAPKLPPGAFLASPMPIWSPEYALDFMDTHGIETQMLSGGLGSSPAELRASNEYGRSLVEAYPTRFGLLAGLPLQDVEAALKEIAYAYDVLSADGIFLSTNYEGVYLGDPKFTPVFEELNRRHATIFIHPANPAGFNCVACGRPAPVIEYTFDTCRTVTDLLYAGVLERCSDIKFILAHAGGPLPTLGPRISTVGTLPWVPHRPELTQEAVLKQLSRLYFDTAIAGAAASIAPVLELADASHIVLGTDFPAASVPVILQNLAALDALKILTPAQRSAVGTNGRALFARFCEEVS